VSRLTTTMLADWLRPLVTSGARVIPGRLPDMPNRAIGITRGSGPGLEMEGLFDVIGIAINCRGGENNLADAEDIAFEVDDIFLGKHVSARTENFLIGEGANSVFVNGIGRTGSAPTQLTIPDATSRYVFTCSYFAYVSTNVGLVNNG
jgi:hypothetical protein